MIEETTLQRLTKEAQEKLILGAVEVTGREPTMTNEEFGSLVSQYMNLAYQVGLEDVKGEIEEGI